MIMAKTLSKKEAIQHLDIEEKEFENYQKYSGEIKGTKIRGRWYFNKQSLDSWKRSKDFSTVLLSRDEYEKCFVFAIQMAYSKSSSAGTGIRGVRSEMQQADDWILGILAEFGLKKFLKKRFKFKDLKKADLRKLKKVLRPLGLEHTRSKNLKDLSKKILADFNGKVPETKEELLSLPGVGPYTANAVLCFAFDHDVSMLDVNITRVLKRVFSLGSKNSRDRADKHLWEFAESLPPKGKGKEFNYAILDFAGDVCTARKPKCESCPMRKICDYVRFPSDYQSTRSTHPRQILQLS